MMEEQISAEQLIFTRVELPYSPRRTGGYQTVYRTAGLQPNLTEEIEKRIRCYQTQRDQSVERIQFFRVGDLYALSQTVPISPHPEIVDKMRRDGTFMVHCLLLDRANFAAIDYNPFHIFANHDCFYTSIERVIDKFGQATGSADLHRLQVSKQAFPNVTWPADELVSLTKLTIAAEQITQDRNSILLVGDQPEIREALQLAFSLIPPSIRTSCTFDSYIAGCPTSPGSYWAVGSPARTSQRWFVQFDVNKRHMVQGQPPNIPDNEYTRWLSPILREGKLEKFQRQAHTVQALYEASQHNIPFRREQLTSEGCEAFYQHNQELVVRNLKTTLATRLNEHWANLLTSFAFQEYQLDSLVPIAVNRDIEDNDLAQILVAYLASTEHIKAKDSDWQLAQNIARKTQEHRLLHWASTLMKNADKKMRDQALIAMNATEYERTLEKLLYPIPPEHFVTPKHLSLLIDRLSQHTITDKQYIELVETILDCQQAQHLSNLAPRVKTLDKKYIKQLEKIIQLVGKSHRVPPDFRWAVETRKKEISSSFLKDKIFGLFRFKRE